MNNRLPLYGIRLESESGVIVDNFSFRGISGTEFASIDTSLLHSVAAANIYDLFIFQYGVNVLYRPNDTANGYYHRRFVGTPRTITTTTAPANRRKSDRKVSGKKQFFWAHPPVDKCRSGG